MRPVGRGIEVSVLGERILKSGAKEHSLEIRCLTVYDMAFIFPIIVGGREVQVAAEALDLGIEARYPAVKTASGNAGLIIGGEIPRTDELANRMFRRARRTVDVLKALSDNEEPDIGMHEKVDGQTGNGSVFAVIGAVLMRIHDAVENTDSGERLSLPAKGRRSAAGIVALFAFFNTGIRIGARLEGILCKELEAPGDGRRSIGNSVVEAVAAHHPVHAARTPPAEAEGRCLHAENTPMTKGRHERAHAPESNFTHRALESERSFAAPETAEKHFAVIGFKKVLKQHLHFGAVAEVFGSGQADARSEIDAELFSRRGGGRLRAHLVVFNDDARIHNAVDTEVGGLNGKSCSEGCSSGKTGKSQGLCFHDVEGEKSAGI